MSKSVHDCQEHLTSQVVVAETAALLSDMQLRLLVLAHCRVQTGPII